jgi:hypothetical protein
MLGLWNGDNFGCEGDANSYIELDNNGDGACGVWDGNIVLGSVHLLDLPPDGSCPPSGGEQVETPPPSWDYGVQACGAMPEAGACELPAGEGSCLADPHDGFEQAACVYKTGDAACPVGYPTQWKVFAGYDDQRTCSACGCAPGDDQNCEYFGAVFGGETCYEGAPSVEIDSVDGCVSAETLPEGASSFAADSDPNNLIECDPSGGAPSGSVIPKEQTTICCSYY